jgi:hypothetical protein
MSQDATYGILKPCYRCRYAKSHEPVLIFSKHRGPRVIVDKQNGTFVRHGECVGYELCGRCFEQAEINLETLSCRWHKI